MMDEIASKYTAFVAREEPPNLTALQACVMLRKLDIETLIAKVPVIGLQV